MIGGRGHILVVVIAIAIAAPTRSAAADPALDHVITAPTAWIPPGGAVVVTTGGDHRLGGSFDLTYGLGDLASLDFGVDSDLRACAGCDETADQMLRAHAAFRLGAHQDAWFRGMPALAFETRVTIGSDSPFDDTRATSMALVASRVLGPLRLHLGATLTHAAFTAADGAAVGVGPTARPALGVEWTPGIYPRTSLMGDVTWLPRFDAALGSTPPAVKLEWVADWGVRYQALRWASIELAVRHREDEGLAQSSVLVRLNGVFRQRVERSSSSNASRE